MGHLGLDSHTKQIQAALSTLFASTSQHSVADKATGVRVNLEHDPDIAGSWLDVHGPKPNDKLRLLLHKNGTVVPIGQPSGCFLGTTPSGVHAAFASEIVTQLAREPNAVPIAVFRAAGIPAQISIPSLEENHPILAIYQPLGKLLGRSKDRIIDMRDENGVGQKFSLTIDSTTGQIKLAVDVAAVFLATHYQSGAPLPASRLELGLQGCVTYTIAPTGDISLSFDANRNPLGSVNSTHYSKDTLPLLIQNLVEHTKNKATVLNHHDLERQLAWIYGKYANNVFAEEPAPQPGVPSNFFIINPKIGPNGFQVGIARGILAQSGVLIPTHEGAAYEIQNGLISKEMAIGKDFIAPEYSTKVLPQRLKGIFEMF